jgi:hypothetical protein
MLNEGTVVGTPANRIKAEVVKHVRMQGPVSQADLEQAVFRGVTGHDRDEVDWNVEENRLGYAAWTESLRQLIGELVDDGHLEVDEEQRFTAVETEPATQREPGMEQDYFDKVKGWGVLSTASTEGVVNAAVFSRPHAMEDGTYGFIMPERLTWANLQQNGHASYLFRESTSDWRGVRLHLALEHVVDDQERIAELRRRTYDAAAEEQMKPLHLVCFKVVKELPLIGPGPTH